MPELGIACPELTELQIKMDSPAIREARQLVLDTLAAQQRREAAFAQCIGQIARKERVLEGLMQTRSTWTPTQHTLFRNLSNELNHLRHQLKRMSP